MGVGVQDARSFVQRRFACAKARYGTIYEMLVVIPCSGMYHQPSLVGILES